MSEPRGLRALFDVRAGEGRVAASMCVYFFLVITSFWILKPLKKTLFIGHYVESGMDAFGRHFAASEAELFAKVANMVVAGVAAAVFSILAQRLRRQQLTYVFTTAFVLAYGLFAWVLIQPGAIGVWSFYLFGDLFSTLMVATFFSFLNDSVSPDAAKRLYGMVGFGGVAGGVFGATAVRVWIDDLSLQVWLAIAAGIGLLILLVARVASQALPRVSPMRRREGASPEAAPARTGAGAAIAGVKLVAGSSYLLSLVAIVGLYELVSTVLDFQFTSAIVAFSDGDEARSRNFATVYAMTNWLSMFVQLLLTSLVMRRLGLVVALLVLPGAMALASAGFLLLPSLVFGGLLSISDNGFSYSINQSSKEALYVPTTAEEKYQAKAFIDMFVQRFAKAIGVGLSLVVVAFFQGIDGIRQLSFFVLPVLALWAFAAVHAGRRFAELEVEAAAEEVRGA